MPSIEEILRTAAEHQQAGRLAQAEKLYRQVLQENAQNPDAIHGMGLLAMQ